MSPKIKSILLNFAVFFPVYLLTYLILFNFVNETSQWWYPFVSAIVAFILCPKFQGAETKEGKFIFMSWIFMKGIKQFKS